MIKKLAGVSLTLFVVFFGSAATSRSQSVTSPNASPGTIRGRVTQHGKGLGDVVLKAWRPPSPAAARGALETKTDNDGYYLLTSVPPGNYYVGVFRPGFVPKLNDKISGSPRTVLWQPVKASWVSTSI